MDELTAIHQRYSVRSYADRPVDPALLEQLLRSAENADHVGDPPSRVALISGAEEVRRVLTFIVGSYGLVLNAPHLLGGIMPTDCRESRLDLGYVLEQVVLDATRLGLGTCWITGNYDPEQAGEVVRLGPEEVAAAVCALGHPTERGLGRLHTSVIRRLAGGHKRKPLTEIVFSERWGQAWAPEAVDPALVTVLEYARIAPSAHNGQPWRFIMRRDGLLLSVVTPAFVDAGIVMSHVTLASAAVEREGRWELRLDDPTLASRCNLPKGATLVAEFRFSSS